jgi:hypothetical protein
VHKLHVLLAGTRLQSSLTRAVADALHDDDTRVLACALAFLGTYPRAEGAERLAEVADTDVLRFRGRPRSVTGWSEEATLEDTLYSALGMRLRVVGRDNRPLDGRALEVAHRVVLQPGLGLTLLPSLGQVDREWLAAHAEEIAAASPGHAYRLLWSLGEGRHPNLRAVAGRVAGVSGVRRDDLAAWLQP